MKAGIYLVKDSITESTYVIALNGKEPFIRITNAISMTSFANGNMEKCHEIINKILEEPTNYTFVELSKEIEKPTEPAEEILNITVSAEEYLRFTKDEFIQSDGNLNKIDVISDIVACYHITWKEAEQLFEIVNNHFLEHDKWQRIKENSYSNEACSVIE